LRIRSAHLQRGYLQKRIANNAFWTKQATQHGGTLEATASTDWVRAASLRRLKSVLSENDHLLEIGCGNANSLLGPLSHSCRAFGVDITLEMLVAAKQGQNKIIGLARSDACHLPFPDRTFDVVYTSRCLINVLDPEMQLLAITELFRVTKQDGTVILIENWEEPVAAMNRAINEWGAGDPINDEHNLLLGLERTLMLGEDMGWHPVRVQGNTMASFVANILIRKIGWRRVATMINRLIYPLYRVLTWTEDRFGSPLPLFGKDTMVIFKRAYGHAGGERSDG
jgi:SAM-dependent methyltransferase